MKKIGIGALAAAGILAFSAAPALAADKITVKVDGKEVAFDQEPIIVEDRVMVPIRFVAEAMGWDVGYDQTYFVDEAGNPHREAYAYMNKNVEKYVDEVTKFDILYSTTIFIDSGMIESYCGAFGTEYSIKNAPLNVKPVIVNDRTLIGVRDIAEGVYADVEWIGDTRTVNITTNHPTLFPRYMDVKYLEYVPQEPENGETAELSQEAEQVLFLVNRERLEAGLQPMYHDKALQSAADVRAGEIVELFEHQRPDGRGIETAIQEADKVYGDAGRTIVGENIAEGMLNPDTVMEAWMNSPGHKANILKKEFKKIGIGVYEKSGITYWVQMFSD
ncbi:MAG: hypothetical protein IJS35_03645 [Firmicutes bacterium]|nr:hypothetical protein [Bacillota bacterium]